MDVLKLESSYLPGSLVEGYTSMIWSERHLENGDFQMITPKIEETRALIPEGSLITHRETKEVMLVETHDVAVNEEGIPELTVEGRSLETVSEKRTILGQYNDEPWSSYKAYKASEIAALLLWTYLVDTSGQDPSRPGGTHDVDDAIANFLITDSSILTDTPQNWSLNNGDVYSQLKDILSLGGLGIRAIRPPGTTGNVVTFDISATASRGTVSKVSTPDISKIRLDIYSGADRTRFQSVNEPVIFHYDSGHIESPKYLFSVKDFCNVALVHSSLGVTEVWPETGTTPPSTPPTGLERRVLFVDGGTQGSETLTADFTKAVIQKGMVELAKRNRMYLFDGAISPVSPYIYGQHYFLGDKVTLIAQYGFEEEMVVTEYVRTEDAQGDRGYPTLIKAS